MSLTLATAAIIGFVHKKLKDSAVTKAKKKVMEEQSVANKFYLFVKNKRSDVAWATYSIDQDFQHLVERLKSVIKTYGGDTFVQSETTQGTVIYFNMSRSSSKPMLKELHKYHPELIFGETKI